MEELRGEAPARVPERLEAPYFIGIRLGSRSDRLVGTPHGPAAFWGSASSLIPVRVAGFWHLCDVSLGGRSQAVSVTTTTVSSASVSKTEGTIVNQRAKAPSSLLARTTQACNSMLQAVPATH